MLSTIRNAGVAALALSLFYGTAALADAHGDAAHGGEAHGEQAANATIVDVATEAGSFTTLLTALDAADLTSVLEGEGPFTVFAPTDEAFAALPAGALENLLANPDQLAQVLTLHVVAGEAMAKDVVNVDSVTTLEGSSLPIDASEGVKVADATVINADVTASNGVIHVIDRVILPKS